MAIREELVLEFRQALNQIDQLEAEIQARLGSGFDLKLDTDRIAGQVESSLDDVRPLAIPVDQRSVEDDLEQAVAAVEAEQLRFQVDSQALATDLDSAVGRADTSLDFEVDQADITQDINRAVDAADTEVPLEVDAAIAEQQIRRLTDRLTDLNTRVIVGETDIIDAQQETRELQQQLDNLRGNVLIDDTQLDNLQTSLRQTQRAIGSNVTEASRFRDVLRGFRGALAGAGLIIGIQQIGQAISAAITQASDLEEAQSKVNVVFGDSAGIVNTFAANAVRDIGAAEQQALEFTGTIGNLFTAFGLSQQEAAGFSTEVVQLAADLASFNNTAGGTEEALTALRSGLVGEAEPLKRLGVALRAADVDQRALANGFVDANGQITEQGRILARYEIILEQTRNAQGDFARTSDGFANSQRRLSAAVLELQASIGTALLPALTPLVQVLEQVITGAEPLADVLGSVLTEAGELLSDVLTNLVPILVELVEIIGSGLSSAIGTVQLVLGPFLDILGLVAGVLDTLGPVTDIAAQAIGTLVGAFAVGKIAIFISTLAGFGPAATAAAAGATAATGATTGLIASVRALGAAILANPIGLFVTALAGVVAIGAGVFKALNSQKDITEQLEQSYSRFNEQLDKTRERFAGLEGSGNDATQSIELLARAQLRAIALLDQTGAADFGEELVKIQEAAPEAAGEIARLAAEGDNLKDAFNVDRGAIPEIRDQIDDLILNAVGVEGGFATAGEAIDVFLTAVDNGSAKIGDLGEFVTDLTARYPELAEEIESSVDSLLLNNDAVGDSFVAQEELADALEIVRQQIELNEEARRDQIRLEREAADAARVAEARLRGEANALGFASAAALEFARNTRTALDALDTGFESLDFTGATDAFAQSILDLADVTTARAEFEQNLQALGRAGIDGLVLGLQGDEAAQAVAGLVEILESGDIDLGILQALEEGVPLTAVQLAELRGVVEGEAGAIDDAFADLRDEVADILGDGVVPADLADLTRGQLEDVADAVATGVDTIDAALQGATEPLETTFEDLFTNLQAVADQQAAFAGIIADAEDFGPEVQRFIENAGPGIVGAIERDFGGDVQAALGAVTDTLAEISKQPGVAIVDGLIVGVTDEQERLIEAAVGVVESTADAATREAFEKLQETGLAAANGLELGFDENLNLQVIAGEAAQGFELTFISRMGIAGRRGAEAAVREARRTFQISSPSRVFRDIGDDSAEGFASGFENVVDATAQIAADVEEAFVVDPVTPEIVVDPITTDLPPFVIDPITTEIPIEPVGILDQFIGALDGVEGTLTGAIDDLLRRVGESANAESLLSEIELRFPRGFGENLDPIAVIDAIEEIQELLRVARRAEGLLIDVDLETPSTADIRDLRRTIRFLQRQGLEIDIPVRTTINDLTFEDIQELDVPIPDSLATLAQTLAEPFDAANVAIRGAADDVELSSRQFIGNLEQGIAQDQRFREALATLADRGLDDLAAALAEQGPGAVELAEEFVRNAANAAEAETLIETDLSVDFDVVGAARDARRQGDEIAAGFLEGLRDALEQGRADELARIIIEAFEDELGISSPSRVFAAIGVETAEGFTVGFEEAIEAPVIPEPVLPDVEGIEDELALNVAAPIVDAPVIGEPDPVPVAIDPVVPDLAEPDPLPVPVDPFISGAAIVLDPVRLAVFVDEAPTVPALATAILSVELGAVPTVPDVDVGVELGAVPRIPAQVLLADVELGAVPVLDPLPATAVIAEAPTVPALDPVEVELVLGALPELAALIVDVAFGDVAALESPTVTADVEIGTVPELDPLAADVVLGDVPELPRAVVTADIVFGEIPELAALTAGVELGAVPELARAVVTADVVLGEFPEVEAVTVDVLFGDVPTLAATTVVADVELGQIPALDPLPTEAVVDEAPAVPSLPPISAELVFLAIPTLDPLTGEVVIPEPPTVPALDPVGLDLVFSVLPTLDPFTGAVVVPDAPTVPDLADLEAEVVFTQLPVLDPFTGEVVIIEAPVVPGLAPIPGEVDVAVAPTVPELAALPGVVTVDEAPTVPVAGVPGVVTVADAPTVPGIDPLPGTVDVADAPTVPDLADLFARVVVPVAPDVPELDPLAALVEPVAPELDPVELLIDEPEPITVPVEFVAVNTLDVVQSQIATSLAAVQAQTAGVGDTVTIVEGDQILTGGTKVAEQTNDVDLNLPTGDPEANALAVAASVGRVLAQQSRR